MLRLTSFALGTIATIEAFPYGQIRLDNHAGLRRAFRGLFDPANHTGKWQDRPYAPCGGHEDYMEDAWDSFASHEGAHTSGLPCLSRCFFRARERFFGLCPHAARPGDRVVILHGGCVPYILRPVADVGGRAAFALVGECYAEGYMYGEALEEQRTKAIQSRTFDLV